MRVSVVLVLPSCPDVAMWYPNCMYPESNITRRYSSNLINLRRTETLVYWQHIMKWRMESMIEFKLVWFRSNLNAHFRWLLFIFFIFKLLCLLSFIVVVRRFYCDCLEIYLIYTIFLTVHRKPISSRDAYSHRFQLYFVAIDFKISFVIQHCCKWRICTS